MSSQDLKQIIFELKNQGMLQKDIAAYLNKNGFRTIRGKEFTQALVSAEMKKLYPETEVIIIPEQDEIPQDDNYVYEKNNKVFTDSRYIAKVFEKRHDNVLRDIEALIKNEKDLVLNFEEIFFADSFGRQQPMYLMDSLGFSVLAMGFTGEKALKFKVTYAKRFAEMEKTLNSRALPAPQKEFTRKELLLMNLEAEERVEKKEKQRLLAEKAKEKAEEKIKSDAPYVQYAKQEFNYIGRVPLSEFGLYLKQKTRSMGPNNIFKYCIEWGFLYRNKKKEATVKADYLSEGNKKFFDIEPTKFKKNQNIYKINPETGITEKTTIGQKDETNWKIFILSSGMMKVIELAYKSRLISQQEYMNISSDLPAWINTGLSNTPNFSPSNLYLINNEETGHE